jgi:hypothetical protein
MAEQAVEVGQAVPVPPYREPGAVLSDLQDDCDTDLE